MPSLPQAHFKLFCVELAGVADVVLQAQDLRMVP
jgi:hypothetical protein